MRHNEQIQKFELTAGEVKKGDEIAVVGPWNFWRGDMDRRHANSDVQIDQYEITYWTVAAIGKKIMRLVSKDGKTAKRNIYIADRRSESGEIVKGFQEFITRQYRALALAGALHLTDDGRTADFEIVYPDRLY